MKPVPYNTATHGVAERTFWYKEPPAAIADTVNFIAHVLTYGTPEDVKILRQYVTLDDLREAIDTAPPGVFDPRSWAYWNAMIGRFDAPPMPQRTFSA